MQLLLIHQQILLQSERLREMHRSIMTRTAPVPAAEIEVFLQEIRNLYNLTLQLNNENAIQLLNEVHLAVHQKATIVTESIPETPVVVTTVNKQTEKPMAQVQEIIQAVNKSVAKSEEHSSDKKRILADIHEMFEDTPTLAGKFSDHQTIAEKIAGNDSMKRVSDNLKAHVKDLKSAIGINEKFQFINHLFNGDSKKYNAAIDHLNSSSSAEIAMNSIKDISDSNNWELHAASAKSFIEIIERRFSA